MNLQVSIDSILRQTTILVAQLATNQGARAPLAHVANQVFLDLAARATTTTPRGDVEIVFTE